MKQHTSITIALLYTTAGVKYHERRDSFEDRVAHSTAQDTKKENDTVYTVQWYGKEEKSNAGGRLDDRKIKVAECQKRRI